LRGLRNQADYDMHRILAPDAVPDAIADAERVLQAFDTLSFSERVQITDGIKHYEQKIGDVTWTP
jgi:hypothetical protein